MSQQTETPPCEICGGEHYPDCVTGCGACNHPIHLADKCPALITLYGVYYGGDADEQPCQCDVDWSDEIDAADNPPVRCLTCGCTRDDHFAPDWYDPRTQVAYENGHLNHCGDCAACYEPEYAEEGRA